MLPHITATAYLTALREGGSLPGLVEADDLGTYVVKFTGAGQGPRALVAEIVVGRLGQELGIRIPELALIDVDPEIGRREPDEEVQDLVAASAGLNLAMDFLPGSIGYDRSFDVPVADASAGGLAGRVRGQRRPQPTQHQPAASGTRACGRSTTAPACDSTTPGAIRDGSPSPPTTTATTCSAASVGRGTCTTSWRRRSPRSCSAAILADVPDAWLAPDATRPDPKAPPDAASARERYVEFLTARLAAAERWLP